MRSFYYKFLTRESGSQAAGQVTCHDFISAQPAGESRVWILFPRSRPGNHVYGFYFRAAGRKVTRHDFFCAHARLASVGWRKNLVLAHVFSGSVSQNVPVAQRFEGFPPRDPKKRGAEHILSSSGPSVSQAAGQVTRTYSFSRSRPGNHVYGFLFRAAGRPGHSYLFSFRARCTEIPHVWKFLKQELPHVWKLFPGPEALAETIRTCADV